MTRQVHTFTWRAIWAVMLFLGTLTHQPDPQTADPEAQRQSDWTGIAAVD